MRPGEMLNLNEADINIGESGAYIIPHPKEKKPKIIYLIEEDYVSITIWPEVYLIFIFSDIRKESVVVKQGKNLEKSTCINGGREPVKN